MSAPDYGFVAERVALVRERIEAAARRAGRDPASIELMAVTKFNPLEAVLAASAAGLSLFGESRVQEAEEKFPAFLASRPASRLELIGHLQSNKAKKALRLFTGIQSVDSLELVAELSKRAAQLRAEGAEGAAAGGAGAALAPGRAGGLPRRIDLLLELHTGEESKSGFASAEELYRVAELLLEPERASLFRLRGLMTMAPYTSDQAPIRASFRALRAAFEGLRARFDPPDFDTLSMGMTNDYEIAVEEGSTLLRLGTALFGEREPPP